MVQHGKLSEKEPESLAGVADGEALMARLAGDDSEPETLGMSEPPDAGHFEEHDEDAESEIDVPGTFRGEDRRRDTTLAESDYEYALMFHDPIGNRLMKRRDHEAEDQA